MRCCLCLHDLMRVFNRKRKDHPKDAEYEASDEHPTKLSKVDTSTLPVLRVGGVPEHFNLPWHLAIEVRPRLLLLLMRACSILLFSSLSLLHFSARSVRNSWRQG